MSEHLAVEKPIYPAISLLSTMLILVVGLLTAKTPACIWFLTGMWVILLLFGCWRACLAVIPVATLICAVLAGVTYAISRDLSASPPTTPRWRLRAVETKAGNSPAPGPPASCSLTTT